MLDTFIIEEIKRRDREQSRDDRPVIELPLPSYPPERDPRLDHEDGDDENRDRGVVIIDYAS